MLRRIGWTTIFLRDVIKIFYFRLPDRYFDRFKCSPPSLSLSLGREKNKPTIQFLEYFASNTYGSQVIQTSNYIIIAFTVLNLCFWNILYTFCTHCTILHILTWNVYISHNLYHELLIFVVFTSFLNTVYTSFLTQKTTVLGAADNKCERCRWIVHCLWPFWQKIVA